jgi:hypothetical protein
MSIFFKALLILLRCVPNHSILSILLGRRYQVLRSHQQRCGSVLLLTGEHVSEAAHLGEPIGEGAGFLGPEVLTLLELTLESAALAYLSIL